MVETKRLMRRALTLILLLLSSLPLLAPLLMARAADGVQVCCRRNGKHHCAMEPRIGRTVTMNCPMFRSAAGAPAAPRFALWVNPRHEGPAFVVAPLDCFEDSGRKNATRIGAVRKRGPPFLPNLPAKSTL